jgi:hypothetical protein
VSTTLVRRGEGVHHTLYIEVVAAGLPADGLSHHLSNSADARRSSAVCLTIMYFKRIAQSPQMGPPTNEGIPQGLHSHYRYARAGCGKTRFVWLIWFVLFIWLIWFIWSIWFNQDTGVALGS